MPNHIKPTKEELAAQTAAAIEEAEKLKDAPPEEEEEVVEPPVKEEAEAEEPVEEAEEEEAEPSKEVKERLKEEVKEKDKKLSASARENQKIYAKNRVINQALVKADDIPEPTEEELTKEYPDWDVMSDIEKTFAKETVISRKWRTVISEAKEQATKIEKWQESVDTFIDDPKTLVDNPALEGKGEEFKTFANEEGNNSVPFNILVSAFLYQKSTNKPNNKGGMFPRGSGGSNEKPVVKKDTITLEEAKRLRESSNPEDNKKHKEYLKAGKIEMNF